eukprot:6161627-Pyramimonas_sp.AAC.1
MLWAETTERRQTGGRTKRLTENSAASTWLRRGSTRKAALRGRRSRLRPSRRPSWTEWAANTPAASIQ